MATKKTTNDMEQQKKPSRRRASAKKTEQRSDEILASLDVQTKSVVSNISMLYNTITELLNRGDIQKIKYLNAAQDENFARLEALDSELAVKMREKYQTDNNGMLLSKQGNKKIIDLPKQVNQTDEFLKMFNESQRQNSNDSLSVIDNEPKDENIFKNMVTDDVDELYDVLSLPSNGQCYPNKQGKIGVSYLTATDENFITSPNLYRDGLITDCLLHRKVVDKSFDVDNLVSGDADAILYFLRVSSYGADFPAKFTDPETDITFDTVIDLGQIKTKDFKLIGDENGYFDYELPVTKDKVKFKFLTKKDERKLERLNQLGNNATKAIELRSIAKYLESFLEDGSVDVENDEGYRIEDGIETITSIADRISEEEGLPVNKLVTNTLEMSIISVNGNTDRAFIKKYVQNMVARDSLSLRRYILENTPGLDFNVRIEKPASLGGGFIDTFLEWGDTIFLSIT